MAIRIRASFTTFELDGSGFTKKLRSTINTQMKRAAKAYALVAAPAVPFRTGFARGIFQNVMAAAGTRADLASLPASRSIFSSSLSVVSKPEYYNTGSRRFLKSPQAAKRFATQPENILKEQLDFKFVFNFATSISYFKVNDIYDNLKTPSAPWGSLEKGIKEFLLYLRVTAIKELPAVTSFMYASRISIDGETVQRDTGKVQ